MTPTAKKWLVVLTVVILLGGGYGAYIKMNRMIPVGPIRINPAAEIDPERSYHLIVWEPEVILPWDAGAHRRQLEQAIVEFGQVRPNIHVEIHILPWDDRNKQLQEALAQGRPPDLYGMPLGAQKMSAEWQVPVNPYLTADTESDLLLAARKSVTADKRMWAWPRWILPRQWVVREDLADVLQERRYSWSTQDFLTTIDTVAQHIRGTGVVLNPFDGSLFFDVMATATGKNVIDSSGQRAWTKQEIIAGLDFFQQLIDRGLTHGDIDTMSRGRLDDFWNQRTVAVAPINPWLMRHMLTRGGVASTPPRLPAREDGGHHLVAPIPPPSWDPAKIGQHQPAVVAGYAVFRQEPYPGDDHTRAAMLLAEHLSRRLGPWEASQLFSVPAHPSSWDQWRTDTGLPPKESDLLIHWATVAFTPPLDEAYALLQQRAIDAVLPAHLVQLWEGTPPDTIAENMVRSIDGLMAVAKR